MLTFLTKTSSCSARLVRWMCDPPPPPTHGHTNTVQLDRTRSGPHGHAKTTSPTCMVPAPDPNVGMGNGVKGSDLAKRLRQEMTASSKDEKQSLGADDGGQEGGKKAAADSGRQHSNWACLHLLVGFLEKICHLYAYYHTFCLISPNTFQKEFKAS